MFVAFVTSLISKSDDLKAMDPWANTACVQEIKISFGLSFTPVKKTYNGNEIGKSLYEGQVANTVLYGE